MTPELWKLLESVFQGALDRDPRERDEYLRQACGGDEALRREVEKLLAAHEGHSFLEPWAAAAARRVLGKTGGLEEGQRLGPYRIEKHLASGGMGMVYRAHDTRLDRTVAIKMLLPAPLGDEIRIRLKREAQAIAQLQHPNICALYDIGEENGREYLVMEYLEGETLATRLRGGALPLRLAIEYAIAVASALEHLHRRNITHRDLKPSNIMIARTGLKLLDFGLATWLRSAEPTPWMQGENVTTRSFELTMPGALIGTPPYMAPEQIRGEHTDSRTDMFAFGLLLYEMLAGLRAFDQDDRQALMRAILDGQPPLLREVRPEIQPTLTRVVELCLAKDPDERWQNAGDLKRELAWILSGDSPAAAPLTRRRMAAWGAAAFGAVATGWFGNHLRRPTPAEQPVHTYLYPPDREQFTPGSGLALSPDGRRVAYVTTSADSTEMLWIRTLEDRDGRPLRGTGGARMPFWSPDGRYVAFFAEQRLKKTDASGGPVEVICEAAVPRGGTWGPEDTILLVPFAFSGVHRVSAKGGELVPVTQLDRTHEDYQHYWPRFLPDGRHFLFTSQSESRGAALQLGSLDSAEVKSLGPFGRAVFQSGRLYFTDQGALKWQPFDLGRLELTGKLQLVANLESITSFDAAGNGTLVYRPSNIAGTRELAWFDRTGRTVSAPFEPDLYQGVSLSPDGRTAAVVIPDAGGPHIWLCDTASGSRRLFVTHAAFPVWSPDGRRIAYTSFVSGPGTVCARSSDGSGAEEVFLQGLTDEATTSWSPDGRSICYVEHTMQPVQGFAIWLLPSSGDHKPSPFLTPSKGYVTQGAFSPNGKWLAYQSDQHVSADISVIRFPDKSGKIRVSHGGGGYPLWRSDGRELFYIDGRGRLVAVGVVPRGSDLVFGDAQPLFTLTIGRWALSYATLDGRRFLAIRSNPTSAPWPIVAIFHAAGSAL